jgi:hypothetical protein
VTHVPDPVRGKHALVRVQLLAPLLIGVLACAPGCSREPARSASPPSPSSTGPGGAGDGNPQLAAGHAPGDGGPVEFIQENFAQLYPIFLVRRSMPRGEKSGLWHRRYYGRWVRWTGKVMSFTPNGITLRAGWQAVTFDVSLWLEADQLPLLSRLNLKKGDKVTFIGKLDSYDDIFQQFYLRNGALLSEVDPAAPDTTKIPDAGYGG